MSILVQEEFQGKEIGEGLMTKSLKWLESKRCHGIKLAVAKGNEAYSVLSAVRLRPRMMMLERPSE